MGCQESSRPLLRRSKTGKDFVFEILKTLIICFIIKVRLKHLKNWHMILKCLSLKSWQMLPLRGAYEQDKLHPDWHLGLKSNKGKRRNDLMFMWLNNYLDATCSGISVNANEWRCRWLTGVPLHGIEGEGISSMHSEKNPESNLIIRELGSVVYSRCQPLALSVAAVIHVIEKSVGGEVGWKGRKRGRK